MRNCTVQIFACLLLAIGSSAAFAQTPVDNTIRVTPENFNRAESDLVFNGVVKQGGFGKYSHHREVLGPGYPIVRPNRDT
jgi:hypothetical protein